MSVKRTAEAIEIIGRTRRHRTKAERRGIVEESLEPGASVAVIARLHGVNANQVFHWRKLYREGRLEPKAHALLPVRITGSVEESGPAGSRGGTIHIELSRARVRIEGTPDGATLAKILEQLAQ